MSAKEKKLEIRSRQLSRIVMSAGEKSTFAVQLSLQLPVLVFELPVLQEKLVMQLSPSSRAILERGNISFVCEDSCRVICTRPSTNYSTESR